jgi:hypothetical protein
MNNEPKASQSKPVVDAGPSAEPGSFHLVLVETGLSRKIVSRAVALAVSLLGLWLVVAATLTDLPRQWLPYNEEIVQWLAPEAPDGSEPLELLELTHSATGQQFTIQGKIRNRTRQTLEEVIAVVKCWYTHLTIPVEKDVPIDPARLEPGAEGLFKLELPIAGEMTGYSITFKLSNGAIARHKDSRSLSLPE